MSPPIPPASSNPGTMEAIPDHLAPHLSLLFVGYNPGTRSSLLQHHYAGPGNQFWRLLWEAGLTDRLYRPDEDSHLLSVGYGFTNLVARPSGSSADLTPAEMDAGAVALRAKIALYQPRLVCFLGKEVYRRFAGLKSNAVLAWGPVPIGAGSPAGSNSPIVAGFMAPNPSARSTIPYAEKLAVFRQLRAYQLSLMGPDNRH